MGEYQADASGNYNLSSEAENTVEKDMFVWTSAVSSQCAHLEESTNEETQQCRRVVTPLEPSFCKPGQFILPCWDSSSENSIYLSPYLTGMSKNNMTCLWNISVFLGRRHSLDADLKSAWAFPETKGRHCFAWFWDMVLQFTETVGPFWVILWSWSLKGSRDGRNIGRERE